MSERAGDGVPCVLLGSRGDSALGAGSRSVCDCGVQVGLHRGQASAEDDEQKHEDQGRSEKDQFQSGITSFAIRSSTCPGDNQRTLSRMRRRVALVSLPDDVAGRIERRASHIGRSGGPALPVTSSGIGRELT